MSCISLKLVILYTYEQYIWHFRANFIISWLFQYGAKIRKGSAASSKTVEGAGVGKEKDCTVTGKVTSNFYLPVVSNAVDCLLGAVT